MPVWEDFAGTERGIVLTIWDASRMRWFARPETVKHPELASWLAAAPFEKWGYFPIDASGPNGKLTAILGDTIKGYDRALCYSKWAEKIVENTIGAKYADRLGLDYLPHGIDTSVFKPHPKIEARNNFRQLGFSGLTDSSFLVGIVATNQARKDYGLGIETCSRLLQQDLDVRVWIHTDTMKRYWDIVALLTDFDLLGRVVVTTTQFSDEQMAWLYSACDVTLGIGGFEGFGYPIFESLACGVHVVHGNGGGAEEHLRNDMTVEPEAFHLEGQFNCLRPVFYVDDWVGTALQEYNDNGSLDPPEPVTLPPTLDWNNLWPNWEEWLRQGVSK